MASAPKPDVVIKQTADTGCQPVGGVEHRDASLFQRIQARRFSPAACPKKCQSHLFVQVPLGDNLLCLGVAAGAGHHQRAHRRVVGHELHNLREGIAVGESGDVRRIGRPSEPFQHTVDSVPSGVVEFRQVQAHLAAHVGRQGADSSGVGHHCQALGRWWRGVGQKVGNFQKLVIVSDSNHTVLGQRGVVKRVQAGERGGMRLGRLGAQVRPADLDEDDWLAAFRSELGYLDKFAGVFESFHESSNHFGVIVI